MNKRTTTIVRGKYDASLKLKTDELASNCITKALCEFLKKNGDVEPRWNGGYNERVLYQWLGEMRKAKRDQEYERAAKGGKK